MMKRLIAAVLAAAIFISPGAAPAAYADTAAVPITAEIAATPVDFEITESVTMGYSGIGNDLTISDIVITNNKAEGMNLIVESISVEPIMGWKLAAAGTDFTKRLNKKEFSISTGSHDFSSGVYTVTNTVEEGQSITFSFTGMAGAFSSKVSEKAANFVVTISLEEALKIVTWEEGTDEEIAAMVAAADAGKIKLTDYWNVGDVRTVSLSAMTATGVGESHAAQDVKLVLMHAGDYPLQTATASGRTTCSFVVGLKDCLNETGYMNKEQTSVGSWNASNRRAWCNNTFRNAFPSALVGIFKQFKTITANGASDYSNYTTTVDYFALPGELEILPQSSIDYSYSIPCESSRLFQFEYYAASENRIKKVNGTAAQYFLRSPNNFRSDCFLLATANGGTSGGGWASSGYGISPFGCI